MWYHIGWRWAHYSVGNLALSGSNSAWPMSTYSRITASMNLRIDPWHSVIVRVCEIFWLLVNEIRQAVLHLVSLEVGPQIFLHQCVSGWSQNDARLNVLRSSRESDALLMGGSSISQNLWRTSSSHSTDEWHAVTLVHVGLVSPLRTHPNSVSRPLVSQKVQYAGLVVERRRTCPLPTGCRCVQVDQNLDQLKVSLRDVSTWDQMVPGIKKVTCYLGNNHSSDIEFSSTSFNTRNFKMGDVLHRNFVW